MRTEEDGVPFEWLYDEMKNSVEDHTWVKEYLDEAHEILSVKERKWMI